MIRALAIIGGVAIYAALVLFYQPAHAATCFPRAAVIEQLASRYGESRRVIGLATTGAVVEVFASPSGSWTLTATTPDGATCILGSGMAFEALAGLPAGEPG